MGRFMSPYVVLFLLTKNRANCTMIRFDSAPHPPNPPTHTRPFPRFPWDLPGKLGYNRRYLSLFGGLLYSRQGCFFGLIKGSVIFAPSSFDGALAFSSSRIFNSAFDGTLIFSIIRFRCIASKNLIETQIRPLIIRLVRMR